MDCATRQELSYIREYFYVGGHYAENGSGRHIFKDQMYVEQLTPVNGSRKPYPIVFIHGGGQTGTVSVFYLLAQYPGKFASVPTHLPRL